VFLNFCSLDSVTERDTADKAEYIPAPLPSIYYHILPLCLTYSIRNSEFDHFDGVDDNDTEDDAG
jgi:hypothetical protein